MKKLCRVLFSRYFISALIILAEIAMMFYLILIPYQSSHWYAFGAVVALNVLTVITLMNRDANPEYKVSWLTVVLLIPPFGTVLYLVFYSRKMSKKEARLMREVYDRLDDTEAEERYDAEFAALKEQDTLAAGKAFAILNDNPLSEIYRDSTSRVFSCGEDMYENMLADISKAEKYIFLEYFIIADGTMWQSIHSLLREKVSQGVEVRVLYDDVGCMRTLPENYCDRLNSEGIRCARFAPVTPRVTAAHNNRDHRKILIVDGRVAYTGGINIADEYINKKVRFGHWKDGGIRVEGKAVTGFLKLFLSLWSVNTRCAEESYDRYLRSVSPLPVGDGGYYIPFGSGPAPIYPRPVGKNLLLNLINQAQRYFYITSPYLVIDYELTEALRNAALRGVDVRIITPSKADKKIVKVMTKSSYPYLMEAGVRIYEYRQGFIHEKSLASDDLYAVIGTVNLDYRSLAHHYEDGVWMYGTPTVIEVREEFEKTLSLSNEQDESAARLNFVERAVRNLVRVFAPLL